MYRLILGKWNRQLWVELHARAQADGLMAGEHGWEWKAFQSLRNKPETRGNAQQADFFLVRQSASPKANEIVVYLHEKLFVILVI